jgi:hypothetical protein
LHIIGSPPIGSNQVSYGAVFKYFIPFNANSAENEVGVAGFFQRERPAGGDARKGDDVRGE